MKSKKINRMALAILVVVALVGNNILTHPVIGQAREVNIESDLDDMFNFLCAPQLITKVVQCNTNWKLALKNYKFSSFTQKNVSFLKLKPTWEETEWRPIKKFYYIPNKDARNLKNPPKKGWIKVTPNKNGVYKIPLSKLKKDKYGYFNICIKYYPSAYKYQKTLYGFLRLDF